MTGNPGLAARLNAVFVAPAASSLETRHRPVVDGEIIELAPEITLTALATPGHTPDHHAYVLTDHSRPVALFSGGSLMVGTVGRADLCGPIWRYRSRARGSVVCVASTNSPMT